MFSIRRRMLSRRNVGFAPGEGHSRGIALETRSLTAPWFYRVSNFGPMRAQVIDLSPSADPNATNFVDWGSTETLALLATQQWNFLSGWSASSYVSSAVTDSGSSTESSTSTVAVEVVHLDEASIESQVNSTSTFITPPLHRSIATSGAIDVYTGMPAPIGWVLAQPDLGGQPDLIASLPTNQNIMTVFSASWNASNTDNSAVPSLYLLSGTLNVALNVGTPGLVITDPNSTSTGLSLPQGSTPPPGEVLFYDAGFGGAGRSDTHTEVLYTSIPTSGAYELPLMYYSKLDSPGIALPASSGPDTSWYQDSFTWSISFTAT